jgi:hypothetical protein
MQSRDELALPTTAIGLNVKRRPRSGQTAPKGDPRTASALPDCRRNLAKAFYRGRPGLCQTSTCPCARLPAGSARPAPIPQWREGRCACRKIRSPYTGLQAASDGLVRGFQSMSGSSGPAPESAIRGKGYQRVGQSQPRSREVRRSLLGCAIAGSTPGGSRAAPPHRQCCGW